MIWDEERADPTNPTGGPEGTSEQSVFKVKHPTHRNGKPIVYLLEEE